MLYSFVFHCDFSNPNRITNKANRTTEGCAIFVIRRRVESSLSKATPYHKKWHLRQQNADLLNLR